MHTAQGKYQTDAQFHSLVNVIENYYASGYFTPSEVREAATLAATHFEMRKSMPPMRVKDIM
jgi:hypothetical protein